jgi:hypothetical protein
MSSLDVTAGSSATKAEGPNRHVIGHVTMELVQAALREVGRAETWPIVTRDDHPLLSQGRSLILRDELHRDTPQRQRFPSVERLVAEVARLGFGNVPGKVLLASLPHGKVTKPHCDSGEYYKFHNRIHVPLVTAEGVSMIVAEEAFHMAVGDVYLFQNLRRHAVRNDSTIHRIHLIIDMLDPRYSPAVYARTARLLGVNLFWCSSLYQKYGRLTARAVVRQNEGERA